MIKHSCKFYGAESRDRKRLREWLIDMVDSNTVHGLRWLDQERKTFRITWKHAGKPDFELEKDAVLFREWAKHTGKYKDGEQPDPSTWKTRFRCALHKMPDVEEVKVPHSLDHPTEPFRVFKILPKSKGRVQYNFIFIFLKSVAFLLNFAPALACIVSGALKWLIHS